MSINHGSTVRRISIYFSQMSASNLYSLSKVKGPWFGGILADFWVPHKIDSWNFQNLFDLGFHETSKNLSLFRQLFEKIQKTYQEYTLGFGVFFQGSTLWRNENKMSSNFSDFTKFLTNQILKISDVYLMWNPEICQDAPNQGKMIWFFWSVHGF